MGTKAMSGFEAAGRVMAAGVAAAKEAEQKGGTLRDVLRAMSRAIGDDGSEGALFSEWMIDNAHRLREACAELGVEVAEGPRIAGRLREKVGPILKARYDTRTKGSA